MRVATAGLAASESTMPVIISTAIAASISRSTVHHQLANRVRSTREIMQRSRSGGQGAACPPGARGHGARCAFARPTLSGHGLRMINKAGALDELRCVLLSAG